MNKHDENRIIRLLRYLPDRELDEMFQLIGKRAIVNRLFNDSQRSELERLEREGYDDEVVEFIDDEVASVIDSLMPTNHWFLDFFDGWKEELFNWFFPDGPAEVILGDSKHDRWLAEEMVERATHVAEVHSFPELPPYGPDEYLFFLVEWRRRLMGALDDKLQSGSDKAGGSGSA